MPSVKDSWIVVVNPFDIDNHYPACVNCAHIEAQYTCSRLTDVLKYNMVTGKIIKHSEPGIKCWESRCGKEDYHCGKEGKFFQERDY